MNNKYRYVFADLLRKRIDFPSDANVEVRKQIAALKSDVLMRTLEKAERIRAFGHIHVCDAKNAPVCNLEFHSGVVKTYNVIDDPDVTEIHAPLRVIFLRSHRNEMWSFKKENQNGNEEKHAG